MTWCESGSPLYFIICDCSTFLLCAQWAQYQQALSRSMWLLWLINNNSKLSCITGQSQIACGPRLIFYLLKIIYTCLTLLIVENQIHTFKVKQNCQEEKVIGNNNLEVGGAQSLFVNKCTCLSGVVFIMHFYECRHMFWAYMYCRMSIISKTNKSMNHEIWLELPVTIQLWFCSVKILMSWLPETSMPPSTTKFGNIKSLLKY